MAWTTALPPAGDIFEKKASTPSGALCTACKGSKLLCGKDSCPILVRFYARQRTAPLVSSTSLAGSSPPGVFIGRFGYPKVLVGPLVPPVHGDTLLLDTPEMWRGRTIEEICNFRFSLVRGTFPAHILDVANGGRVVDATRELALAEFSPDVEALFEKVPHGRTVLDDEVQPFGPSAPLRRIRTGNVKIDRRIERATGDTDLPARDAVLSLYREGLLISRLQRAFSVGAFGIGKRRRFVPTRWSITAVDSTIGLSLLERVKASPTIDSFEVYESWSLDNRFEVLLMPATWRYELIEAWYPNTVWNPHGTGIYILSDHEFHRGRTKYASIGGCYYAARLAVAEHLTLRGRQAGAVILRESHPGYIMPVGVWNVRENVRAALREKPHRFETLRDALAFTATRLAIPTGRWIRNSAILGDAIHQRRLEEFGE